MPADGDDFLVGLRVLLNALYGVRPLRVSALAAHPRTCGRARPPPIWLLPVALSRRRPSPPTRTPVPAGSTRSAPWPLSKAEHPTR